MIEGRSRNGSIACVPGAYKVTTMHSSGSTLLAAPRSHIDPPSRCSHSVTKSRPLPYGNDALLQGG